MSETNIAPASATESNIESSAPAPAPEFGQSQEQANQVQAEKQASQKKKFNLKVRGKAKDVEVDFGNEAELQKMIQKAFAADETFEEAALTRKQMEYLIHELKTNPIGVLQHEALGVNIKELAQKVMEQELEDMSKSPEQKRIEELEKSLKEKEESEKKSAEEKRQEQMLRMQMEQQQALDESISEAITKSSLAKNPYTVQRVVDTMIAAVEMGYVGVTPQEIMPFVEQKLTEELQAFFETSPDDTLEHLIGKKRLDSYRKARVAKGKPAPAETIKNIKDTGKSASASDNKQKTPVKEFKVKDLFGF